MAIPIHLSNNHKLAGGRLETMETVIIIAYAVLGYWAAGQTVYANKIRVGTWNDLFFTRLVVGLFLGFILIPVALIKTFLLNK